MQALNRLSVEEFRLSSKLPRRPVKYSQVTDSVLFRLFSGFPGGAVAR